MNHYQPHVPLLYGYKSVWWSVTVDLDSVKLFADRRPPGWLIALAVLFNAGAITVCATALRPAYQQSPSIAVFMVTLVILSLPVPWWGAFWPNRSEARRGDLLRAALVSPARVTLPLLGVEMPRELVLRIELIRFVWADRYRMRHLVLVHGDERDPHYQLLLREGLNLKGTGRRLAAGLDIPFRTVNLGPVDGTAGRPAADARGVTG